MKKIKYILGALVCLFFIPGVVKAEVPSTITVANTAGMNMSDVMGFSYTEDWAFDIHYLSDKTAYCVTPAKGSIDVGTSLTKAGEMDYGVYSIITSGSSDGIKTAALWLYVVHNEISSDTNKGMVSEL